MKLKTLHQKRKNQKLHAIQAVGFPTFFYLNSCESKFSMIFTIFTIFIGTKSRSQSEQPASCPICGIVFLFSIQLKSQIFQFLKKCSMNFFY